MKCPVCLKEKTTVGPKIIGQTSSPDKRVIDGRDALQTQIMCQDCHDGFNPAAQKCMKNCGAVLFILGKLSPDSDMLGVDRSLRIQNDVQGRYIQCPDCGAKHVVETWQGLPGHGGGMRVTRLLRE